MATRGSLAPLTRSGCGAPATDDIAAALRTCNGGWPLQLVATALWTGLAGIPQADGRITAEPTFDVRHVADAVLYMAGLPLDANVPFLTVMATTMPFIGRG